MLSNRYLALTLNQMLRREPQGPWTYGHFSLIDPKSSDSSFMTITDTPAVLRASYREVAVSSHGLGKTPLRFDASNFAVAVRELNVYGLSDLNSW
jgi:hypothetical protein